MIVQQVVDEAHLPAVLAARRALVYLTVPWSCPERAARATFWRAAEELAGETPTLGVEFFTLDEDAEWCLTWLAGLGLPPFERECPAGVGGMIWLEAGRPVAHEASGCGLTSEEVTARCHRLWGKT